MFAQQPIPSVQEWCDVTCKNQKNIVFNGNPGLKIDILPNATVWDYFNLFITNEIIDLMVVETNRNADQMLNGWRITKASRYSKWTPTDSDEIKLFLGLLIWMRLMPLPS